MYGPAGEHRLTELELPWLPGYEGSRPVRIGNGAHGQFQLDVFGEVLDTFHEGLDVVPDDQPDVWKVGRALVQVVEQRWSEPDDGIWEVRGGRRHFTHSKVMAWVALDRAIRIAERRGTDAPVARWKRVRAEIRAEVLERGVDHRGAFVQELDGTALDASLLLVPLVGFLPADDPRVLATVAAIRDELTHDGFVYRYDPSVTDDGVGGHEGTFLMCTFWLADVLLLQGRRRGGAGDLRAPRRRCATTWGCSARCTTRRRSGCSATSRRPSPTPPLVATGIALSRTRVRGRRLAPRSPGDRLTRIADGRAFGAAGILAP